MDRSYVHVRDLESSCRSFRNFKSFERQNFGQDTRNHAAKYPIVCGTKRDSWQNLLHGSSKSFKAFREGGKGFFLATVINNDSNRSVYNLSKVSAEESVPEQQCHTNRITYEKRRPSSREAESISHCQPRFEFSKDPEDSWRKCSLSLSTGTRELDESAASSALSPEGTDFLTPRFRSDFTDHFYTRSHER